MRSVRVFPFVLILLWLPALVSAQTDFFRRIVVDATGGTTPSTVSHVTFPGLPSRSGETNCLWIDASGNVKSGACGTVTSVGLSMPSVFGVSGSPVTSSGTLAVTLQSPWTWTTGGTFGTTSGALTLTAGSNQVLPPATLTTSLGSDSRRWASLAVGELQAGRLIAQDTIATVGGRVVVAPTTTLAADVSTGATSIQTTHNPFLPGDTLLLERNFVVEVMTVTAGPTGSGPYTYTVTRNVDGTGADAWSAGDAVVALGQVGQGYLDLYATRGSHHVGYAGAVMASGPVHYWSMDYATGTTKVFDAVSGLTYTLQNGATQSATCGIGTTCTNNAWRNPGPSYSNTAIALSDSTVSAARETGDITLEVVVFHEDRTVGQTILSRHWQREWHLQVETSGALTGCQGDGTNYQCWFSGVTLPLNTWTHVAMTRDASTRTLCFYLNGSSSGCGTYASVTIAQQNGEIGIGRSPTFGGGAFRGYISEAAVYARRLTATEIAAHAARRPVDQFGYSTGPTMAGLVRTGTAWTDVAPRWVLGDLNGWYGYEKQIYGFAAGDPSGTHTTIDQERWRLRDGTTTLLEAAGGALTLSGPLTVAQGGGITLTGTSSQATQNTIAWTRAYGSGVSAGVGDTYSLSGLSVVSTQDLGLSNIARPTPGNMLSVTSRVSISAQGWFSSGGGQATGQASTVWHSGPGPDNEIRFYLGTTPSLFYLRESAWYGPDTVTFAADTDTGLVRSGSNVLDLRTGGSARVVVFDTGISMSVPLSLNPGDLWLAGATLASLGTPANGTIRFCSDCQPSVSNGACVSGGTGALAVRQNGAWRCIS